jgi:hypothetical protein
MSIAEIPAGSSEVEILGRLFVDGKAELTRERARYLLELEFSEADVARMDELAERNQSGRLSDRDRDELLGFAKAGCLLGILHSRARRALRKPSSRRRRG